MLHNKNESLEYKLDLLIKYKIYNTFSLLFYLFLSYKIFIIENI